MNTIKQLFHLLQNNKAIGSKQRAYGVDVSRYESDFNPDNATLELDFGITKATEGTTWIDPYFDQLYTQISKLSVNGAYHYLRSGLDGITQAKFFLSVIGSRKLDILAIDFERTGNTINDAFVKILYDCITYVSNNKPECKVVLYTNPDLYDTIIYPASVRLWGKDVFTKWDLWIAHYYYIVNPDGEPYIKNRADWKIWQFSDRGDPASHGTTSYIDRNVFNGTKAEMLAWANKSGVTYPYNGVMQKQGLLNGQKYYLQIIDQGNKLIKVKHFAGTLKTIESTAQADKAQIVVNGDDYVKGGSFFPRGMSYVDGKQYTPPFEGRYWLNISSTNIISYGFGQPPINAYNLTSFIRPLVVDSKLHSGLNDLTNPVNTEIHARSILGINAANQLMILVCEGFVNPDTGMAYAGVTLPQAAKLMLDNGAIFAGEHGGGGDSQLYSLGTMVNESSDRDAGIGWRGVVQALEIFIGENSMTDYYKIIGNDGGNHTIRDSYSIKGNPLYYPGTTNRLYVTNTIGAESGALTSDIYIYLADVPDASVVGGFAAKKGDTWRKVYKVGNTMIAGWTAEIHLGVRQGITITPVIVTPPPTTVSPVVSVSQDTDFLTKTLVITRTRQDGSKDITTDPIV